MGLPWCGPHPPVCSLHSTQYPSSHAPPYSLLHTQDITTPPRMHHFIRHYSTWWFAALYTPTTSPAAFWQTKKRVGFAEPDGEQGESLIPSSPTQLLQSEEQSEELSDESDSIALQMEKSQFDLISPKVQLGLVLQLFLQFVLSCFAGAMIMTIFMDGNPLERTLEDRVLAFHLVQEQRELMMSNVREVRSFAQFGDIKHYTRCCRLWCTGQRARTSTGPRWVALYCPPCVFSALLS